MDTVLKGTLQRFANINSGRIYPAELYEKFARRILPDMRMHRIRRIYEKRN